MMMMMMMMMMMTCIASYVARPANIQKGLAASRVHATCVMCVITVLETKCRGSSLVSKK